MSPWESKKKKKMTPLFNVLWLKNKMSKTINNNKKNNRDKEAKVAY